MQITKYGHCCLLIEHNSLNILTDPGAWTELPEKLPKIDIVLITHEHADHLHIDSLKAILAENPQAKVITNSAVGKIIAVENIEFKVVDDGKSTTESGVLIEGFGADHAPVYNTVPVVENTGYFIANRLFYPGDAFYNPKKAVEILALPVAGPWLTIAQAIEYALEIKPQKCFPVHDGGLKYEGPVYFLPERELKTIGTEFKALKAGESWEL